MNRESFMSRIEEKLHISSQVYEITWHKGFQMILKFNIINFKQQTIKINVVNYNTYYR